MRFDVNAPKLHYYDTGVTKRHIFCGRSATTSRGVLEAYSSQKPQSETVRISMWKGAPNNAERNAKHCIAVMMSFCSILLRFLNRTIQNAEIRCSVWKQTEAHWSIAAAMRMNWKWSSMRSDCDFGDINKGNSKTHHLNTMLIHLHVIEKEKKSLLTKQVGICTNILFLNIHTPYLINDCHFSRSNLIQKLCDSTDFQWEYCIWIKPTSTQCSVPFAVQQLLL